MPIRCGWGNDQQTTYIFQFVGYWGWEELDHSTQNIEKLLNESPQPVNLIFNFADSSRVPRDGINLLNDIARKLLNALDNLNMMLLVGMDPSMGMISQLVLTMNPQLNKRVHRCKTFIDAMSMIDAQGDPRADGHIP